MKLAVEIVEAKIQIRRLPETIVTASTICYRNDVAESKSKKIQGGYKFKSQEKINHLMCIDYIMIFYEEWKKNLEIFLYKLSESTAKI